MRNNTTLSNVTHTYRGCNIDYETLINTVLLYANIVTSIFSFVGNLLVILTVYTNKNLRTSINYFIVSMSVSDILFPLFALLDSLLLIWSVSQRSKLVGNLLCKLLPFINLVSCGVSILTLVAITVFRFFAVMFPMRARVQNKKKRLFVLLLTWVIPMATYSPYLIYYEFNKQLYFCFWNLNFETQIGVWFIAQVSLFLFFPPLIMLVLYPLIIIKLKQRRVIGNVISRQAVVRRKRQNARLTMMFLVITVAFLLCWGPYTIVIVLYLFEHKRDSCNLIYFYNVARITPVVFHAINPVIYFIFLSSFRQGFKNIFRSSCCSRTRPQAFAENFELNNIPQA